MKELIVKEDVLKEILRFSVEEGSSVVCQQLYCDVNNMPNVLDKIRAEIKSHIIDTNGLDFNSALYIAIEIIDKHMAESDDEEMTREEVIQELKSDIEWSKLNRYPYIGQRKVKALNMAIEALQQQPCEDCISRQQVKSDYADWYGYGYKDNWFYKHLSSITPVTPQPKTGHWIEHPNDYECSECHIVRAKGRTGKYNYCPNCGADMRGEEE